MTATRNAGVRPLLVLQQRLDDCARAAESTRAALRARLTLSLQAIAAVVVPRADRQVLSDAAALLDDDELSPARLLSLIEPRRAALEEELADVDAVAWAAEARRLVQEATQAEDVGAASLLLSQAARCDRLAAKRIKAEAGLRLLDDEIIHHCSQLIAARLQGWLESAGDFRRFDAIATALHATGAAAASSSARGVVRSARVIGAGRRYLDAVAGHWLAPLSHEVGGHLLQLQVLTDGGGATAVSDNAVDEAALAARVDDAIAIVAAVAAAIDGFRDYDGVAENAVLWDCLLGEPQLQLLLGGAADGAFVAEVRESRARETSEVSTSIDVEATLALAGQASPAVVVAPRQKGVVPNVVSLPPLEDGEGGRLGRYQLLRRLGSGGMAEVWLARQDGPRGFQKQVVVKRILADHAGDPYFIDLFQKEAAVIAHLHHPNIIDVFDLGVEGDRWFMAMELLRGKSLLELARDLAPKGAFPVDVAARAGADAARGLAHAHLQPVVHRDISPDNLFVTDSGLTKVIDFGVARGVDDKSAGHGGLKGKVPYMAPEIFRGDSFDGKVDVFALGVTLWLLLVGHRPFQGANLGEIMRNIVAMTQPPPPAAERPDLPDDVNELVVQMLAADPQARPSAQTAFEVLSTFAAPLPAVAALVV